MERETNLLSLSTIARRTEATVPQVMTALQSAGVRPVCWLDGVTPYYAEADVETVREHLDEARREVFCVAS